MTEEVRKQNSESEGTILSFVKTLIFILVGVFCIRVTLIEAYRIPSGSMLPTLRIQDHILVTKLNYNLQIPLRLEPLWQFSTPDRGDIVVFSRPDDPATFDDDSKISIIKRVIGLPGETVEVRGTTVFINGKPLAEDAYDTWWEKGGIGDFGPQEVPKGHVFLLGDNRDNSKDSRFWTEHFLPMWRIKGRALIIYWSWDSFKRIGTLLR